MFTVSGRGSTPLFFVSTDGREWGADNLCTRIFWCICVQFQWWSIFGWVPEFTNYHFNHYPQRRGRGVKRPKKIVKILLPMFRQGCLVFTGRGSCCERERKLRCLFQTEEESASISLFSRGIHYGGKGLLSRAGKQEGPDGWDPAGPDHLMPCIKSWLTGPHVQKAYEPCDTKKGKLYIKIPAKTHIWKALSRARCRFLSPLPPESVQLSLHLLQLHQQEPCHLPIRLFLSQHPNAFLMLGYLREKAAPEPREAIRGNLSGAAWWSAGTKPSYWSSVKRRRPLLVLASITCPGITTRSCYLPIVTTPHTS